MKKVLGYLKPYIPLVILAVAFLVGQVYTELSLPNLMSEIVDKGILLQGITPEERNGFIRSIGLEMLGISLLSIVCAVGSGFFAIRISAGVARKLRRDLFAKVNAFSNAEISKFSTASLITRTTNDVTQVQNFINMGLMMMLFAPFMGLGSVYMALKLCRALSWTVLTAVLIIIVVLGVLLAVAVPKFKALQKLTDKLNLVSREGLSGMMVIRAFGNEEHEAERFRAANEDLTFTTRFVMRALALMGPVMAMIMSGLQLAVV
ncbi:MAG: ABC transporter ATP-binding protein, partial [Clostridia bacterium]|nr:ABC transporter ATP-binding protein [Clostridia bacterium]